MTGNAPCGQYIPLNDNYPIPVPTRAPWGGVVFGFIPIRILKGNLEMGKAG